MVEIKIINSGSKGNMYSFNCNNSILIVEIGMPFIELIKNVEIQNIIGAIYTHRHFDHHNKKTSSELRRRGIFVYAGEGIASDGECVLYKNKINKIEDWKIQIFDAPHNINNYGFLIETPTKERIVFVTDAMYCSLNFKNIDCIMVECNHDDDTLIDNFVNAEQSRSHPEHHMGLEDCIDFCKRNVSLSTKQIILIHMSHTNINEDFALKSVQDALPLVKVAVAHSGDTFEIESDDF